jgi:hypothetical protein
VAATFREKPLPSPVDRIWNIGQSLWILALLALIVLKLTGVITWSWWWVLMPSWISGLVLPFRFDLPGIGARIWNLGQRLALPAPIVLKLTGVIAWSWWWVLAPLWISGIVVLAFLCLLAAGYGEQRSGGLTGGGWQWEVALGRFRRSGTLRRR